MSIDKKLSKKLTGMLKLDQEVRKHQWRKVKTLNKRFSDKHSLPYGNEIKRLVRELKSIDSKHTSEMKRIVAKRGWPGKSLVGKRGAQQAWLLVQHADHDLRFQKNCLALLKNAVSSGEATKQQLAYLTDRVLVHESKKQLYGTQFKGARQGKPAPFPTQNISQLDQRRKEMGLESFSDYIKKMKALG